MKIKPDDNWRWFYDSEHERMMLDLADGMLFRSRFSAKMLTPDAFNAPEFSVDDAALFFTFYEKCRRVMLNDAQRAELILNALVASRFLKPLMPKSWYFDCCCHVMQPAVGDVVKVKLQHSCEHARLLVVESGDNAALCLVAQAHLTLAGKTMQLGEAIKVMNDRLLPQSEPSSISYEEAV